jgi:hypothetical protein
LGFGGQLGGKLDGVPAWARDDDKNAKTTRKAGREKKISVNDANRFSLDKRENKPYP